jgi:two-component system NtrC family sensor kinase
MISDSYNRHNARSPVPARKNLLFAGDSLNAIQAIDSPPGKIFIRCKKDTEKNEAILEVEDTGQGIPEEIQDRIFDPFFTTKEHKDGTGLGLSIVYNIVKKHGGHIEVKSAPGKGSTFIIHLPLELEKSEQ